MAYRKLGRDNKHRRSMLATLTKQLITNERIVTTETRAKEVRKYFDKMVTYGKNGSLVSRRLALAFLHGSCQGKPHEQHNACNSLAGKEQGDSHHNGEENRTYQNVQQS